MKIEIRYPPDSYAFWIIPRHKTAPCGQCGGTGKPPSADGKDYLCRCMGSGQVGTDQYEWVVWQVKIEYVRTLTDYAGTKMEYTVSRDGATHQMKEESLFPTKESAQAECDRRNKEAGDGHKD